MKNVKWTLMACALSLQAHALDSKQVRSEMQKQFAAKHLPYKLRSQDNPPPAPPIRQDNMRVSVYKNTFTQNASGGYDINSQVICSQTVKVNVYDSRPNNQVTLNQADGDLLDCASTYQGGATTVHVGGAVELLNAPLFGQPEDFKLALPDLYFDAPPGTSTAPLSTYSMATGGSSDLSAKSMLLTVGSSPDVTCTVDNQGNETCTPAVNESFNAIVDIQE